MHKGTYLPLCIFFIKTVALVLKNTNVKIIYKLVDYGFQLLYDITYLLLRLNMLNFCL